MKIGIISDSHDNVVNVKKAIEKLKEERVEVVIHCGDFCAPYVLGLLKDLEVPVHAIFGNVDGDKFRMTMMKPENVTLHGDFAELFIKGRRIAVVHYPEIAKALAHSHQYDLVCVGHSHEAKSEKVANVLLVNPGEIAGIFGEPTYAVYDTERHEVILKKLE